MSRVLSTRVRRLRQRARLTQAELADQTKLDQAQISRLERKGIGVTTEGLLAIAKVLGTTVSYLCGEEEDVSTSIVGSAEEMPDEAAVPDGLREIASSPTLVKELEITEAEWQQLLNLDLPLSVSRDDCISLLLALRKAYRN